jgi:hypothetical protein
MSPGLLAFVFRTKCSLDLDPSAVSLDILNRVAGWNIFIPGIPIWMSLRAFEWKGRYILWPFGIFYRYGVHFTAIWYILWSFGIHFTRFGMFYQEKSGNPCPEPNAVKIATTIGLQIGILHIS